MSSYFTSDLHFYHGNIIKYSDRYRFLLNKDLDEYDNRGRSWFRSESWKDEKTEYKISRESIECMNNSLIESINKVVGENDTLFNLGDTILSHGNDDRDRRLLREIKGRINCKNMVMIRGNHDPSYKLIQEIFGSCFDIKEINVENQNITLCHYPMVSWNKSHKGSYQFFGHHHSNMENKLDELFPKRKSLDVGIDNAFKLLGDYRPFEFSEIIKIIDNKSL